MVFIGLKLLVMGYLLNTLRYTNPFENSEQSVNTQALYNLLEDPQSNNHLAKERFIKHDR